MQSTASPSDVAFTGRRRPAAFVVRDPRPDEIGAGIDWSYWYVTDEDDAGQSVEQGEDIKSMLSSLRVLLLERAPTQTLLGVDNFFGWMKDEPDVRVSPDLYLLDDPPPKPWPMSWQTWLPGHHPPRWAFEIVADDWKAGKPDWKKDYEVNPLKYAQLGTRELVIFDPHAPELAPNGNGHGASPRVRIQVYRRDADGAFVRVYGGNGPARSEEIDAWILSRTEGGMAIPRFARDAEGKDLVPTEAEAIRAADDARRAADDARRAADDARRAADDARRAAEAKLAEEASARRLAEARMAEMEAELRKLRG